MRQAGRDQPDKPKVAAAVRREIEAPQGSSSSIFDEETKYATPCSVPVDSRLIDIEALSFLREEGFQGRQVRLELLYRASVAGFSAGQFHGLCDGKGPTLTIV